MRKYHILTFDSSREDLAIVQDYNIDKFDITRLWCSGRLESEEIANLILYIDDLNLKITDVIGNPLSLLLFSNRLLEHLINFIKDDVQIFEHQLYINKDSVTNDFCIIHPFKEIACVDLEKSELSYDDDNEISIVGKLYLQSKVIPSDVHIFRLKEDSSVIIVSNELAESLRGKGFNGIAFIKCFLV